MTMIAVYMEIRDGKVKKGSLEALGEAKRKAGETGTQAAAVLAGAAVEGLASGLSASGADKVYCLENPALAGYSSQGYAKALTDFVNEVRPESFFFSATAMGRDLAPRLAAALGVGLASDCTHVAVSGDRFEFTRPIYAGKALLSLKLKTSPQIATLRPNVFPLFSGETGAAEVITKATAISEGLIKGRVEEILREQSAEIDVTEAEVVISGGRGMKGPENFALLRELSALIPRSAVGASRSAVDSGWIGHGHQVGQTGKTVSPNLYLAFGISGAIQHLAGMSSSKVIAAVNKDPEAPIFKVADYGVVGDLFEIIPHLKDELKKIAAE
jgi:electron transfer flavoprotein alpha subunit